MAHSRSGDVNLRPIKKLPNGLKEIKHNGTYITARGEATGSVHKLVADKPADLFIGKDDKGNTFIQVFNKVKHTHTKDHEDIFVLPGIYEQIPEREVDNFSQEFITRKVRD